MLSVLRIGELMTELQPIVLTVTYMTYVSTWIRHMYLDLANWLRHKNF